jgi:hypothetical protein
LKKIFINATMLIFIFTIFIFVYSCKEDAVAPPTNPSYDANTINGTITFVDTNFISDTTVGKYYVSTFGTWPGTPSRNLVIYPQKSGGKYTANYKITVAGDGNWTVALAWVRFVPSYKSWFLGVYDVAGKDTSKAAIWGSHPQVNINGGVGVGNINFNAFIDTTKNLTVYP